MKYLAVCIYPLIVISSLGSCKKDADNPDDKFDYEQAAGLWVPYEVIDQFGAAHLGPFTANSLFGSYAESVQLNSDKTFIPVTWFDQNNITFNTQEAGTFEYLSGNKLRFRGLWETEWEIDEFKGDHLWLLVHAHSGDFLYKFRRQ